MVLAGLAERAAERRRLRGLGWAAIRSDPMGGRAVRPGETFIDRRISALLGQLGLCLCEPEAAQLAEVVQIMGEPLVLLRPHHRLLSQGCLIRGLDESAPIVGTRDVLTAQTPLRIEEQVVECLDQRIAEFDGSLELGSRGEREFPKCGPAKVS